MTPGASLHLSHAPVLSVDCPLFTSYPPDTLAGRDVGVKVSRNRHVAQ